MKFKLGNPEKFSFAYSLLHNTWYRLWFFIWYKRVAVTGYKNIYKKNPIILTPNHQNTAMDALVIIGVQTRQIVWLARADIFKSAIARPILQFIKIMPIYRKQDGVENLENNEKIFAKCVEVLKAGKTLALFPEATHWGFRRLRSTKKAVPRIAFMTEESLNFKGNTQIVPVGIYYDNYTNFRRKILINFGEPIQVQDFEELYKINPQQAYNELKIRIEEEMKKTMIHIQHTDELYNTYESLRYICEQYTSQHFSIKGTQLLKQFQTHKKVIEILDNSLNSKPEIIEQLKNEVIEYNKELKLLNFRDWIVAKKGGDAFQIIWNIIKMIIGIPLFIIGFLTHFFMFHYFSKLSKKLAKDKQFYSTINYGLGFVTMPILYIIYGILYLIFTPYTTWSVFLFLAGILISGVIAFEFYIVFKKTYHMLRFNFLLTSEKTLILQVIKRRKKIIKTFSTLLK